MLYTQRLFQDPDLLRAKLREEANELCEARTEEETIWETADVLYFALTTMVAQGARLEDVMTHLEKRARNVTRRPGNAKQGARL